MSDDGTVTAQATAISSVATNHTDARQIIRLIQCPQCSYALREPMTLPCGHSLCRRCLPPLYKRENITYPLSAGRLEGFLCTLCGLEHSAGDCGVDVTLSKLVDTIASEMKKFKEARPDTPLLLDERLHWKKIIDSSIEVMPRSRVLGGGRLVATYTMVEMGDLDYHSELSYHPATGDESNYADLDEEVLLSLKKICETELDCQICYALVLDPLTTSCGHTFCRKCVARVLDHSKLCPACRRPLPMSPGASSDLPNKCISALCSTLAPELVTLRAEMAAQEEAELERDGNIAIFPCTLAFPCMPTFLHIFEPRYRLMIRRAMEGNGKFGLVMYNRRGQPQGSLGNIHYKQYGTLLQIESLEMLPDGRSLIETKGVSRFKVLDTSLKDGYLVAKTQTIDDISLNEEENREAQECSNTAVLSTAGVLPPLESLSTQDLLQLALDFINKRRNESEPWLHERILAAYGLPPNDPAVFPYWLACVLPISEEEKYQLLMITSVRERLKLTATWIRMIEAQRCYEEERLRAQAFALVQAQARRAAAADLRDESITTLSRDSADTSPRNSFDHSEEAGG